MYKYTLFLTRCLSTNLSFVCVTLCYEYIVYNFLNKKLIFFSTKDTRILSFLVEHYTVKIDIITYYSITHEYTPDNF